MIGKPLSAVNSKWTITDEDITRSLIRLIEVCKDGHSGLEQAAAGIKRPELKKHLSELSVQRSNFAAELRPLVLSLGTDPDESGTAVHPPYRGWLNIKTAVIGKETVAILQECERGEYTARMAYRDALEDPLPTHIAVVLRDQQKAIRTSHEYIRNLCDLYERRPRRTVDLPRPWIEIKNR